MTEAVDAKRRRVERRRRTVDKRPDKFGGDGRQREAQVLMSGRHKHITMARQRTYHGQIVRQRRTIATPA